MSLLGRLKSKVMGNPVIREFELGKQVASAGPGLLWKVHTGIKKSSRQEVSIFVFDKKAPEFDKLPKKQKEALYEMLKKVSKERGWGYKYVGGVIVSSGVRVCRWSYSGCG